MKVVLATVSAVLLGSIPSALSAEPSLRGGAALITDFEDQAAALITDGPALKGAAKKGGTVDKKAVSKTVDKNDTKRLAMRYGNVDKKELKRLINKGSEIKDLRKAIKKIEKKAARKASADSCSDYSRKKECGEDDDCSWDKKLKQCVDADSSADSFDFSEDVFDTEDYDWDEDAEDKSADLDLFFDSSEDLVDFVEKIVVDSKVAKALKDWNKKLKAFKKAQKACKRYDTMSACGLDTKNKCSWYVKKSKCITTVKAPKGKKPKFAEDEEDFYFDSAEDVFDTEDYDWDGDFEDYDYDEDYDEDYEDYDWEM